MACAASLRATPRCAANLRRRDVRGPSSQGGGRHADGGGLESGPAESLLDRTESEEGTELESLWEPIAVWWCATCNTYSVGVPSTVPDFGSVHHTQTSALVAAAPELAFCRFMWISWSSQSKALHRKFQHSGPSSQSTHRDGAERTRPHWRQRR